MTFSPFRRFRKGLTLIELMSALAIAGLITAGAIYAFNTATDRADGNAILQGLQPFLVDMNNFLSVHYTDVPEGFPDEATYQASSTYDRKWTGSGSPPTAALSPAITVTATMCRAASVPWSWCTGAGTGTVPTPAPTMTNSNEVRFHALPSMRHFSGNDPDGVAEWEIIINDQEQLDVEFALTPAATDPIVAAATGIGCAAPADATLPDTSVAMRIAIEDLDVCEHVSNALVGYEIVQEARCLDGSTSPTWAAPTGNTYIDGEATLNICFQVMR